MNTFERFRRGLHMFEGLDMENQGIRDGLLGMITDVEAEFTQKIKASSEAINDHGKLKIRHGDLRVKHAEALRTIITHEKTIEHLTQVIKDQQNELAEQERAVLEHESW